MRDNEKNDTPKDYHNGNIIKEKSIDNISFHSEKPNGDINTMEHNPDDRDFITLKKHNMEHNSNDRNFIDLIKGNILKEKKWNEDIQNMLKEQVAFLKQEVSVKNSLTESLIT